MFQVDHGYVKREKKFSLEQCVFIPLPKERGISDSALSHSSYSTQLECPLWNNSLLLLSKASWLYKRIWKSMLLTSYHREVKQLFIACRCGSCPSEETIVGLFLIRQFSG